MSFLIYSTEAEGLREGYTSGGVRFDTTGITWEVYEGLTVVVLRGAHREVQIFSRRGGGFHPEVPQPPVWFATAAAAFQADHGATS